MMSKNVKQISQLIWHESRSKIDYELFTKEM